MYSLKEGISTYAAKGICGAFSRSALSTMPANSSQSMAGPKMLAVPPRCTILYWNFRLFFASWAGIEYY
jgi:hypothetical protein